VVLTTTDLPGRTERAPCADLDSRDDTRVVQTLALRADGLLMVSLPLGHRTFVSF